MAMAVLVLATGCRALFGLDDPASRDTDGGTGDDGATADARLCWGSEFAICLEAPPTGPVELADTLDTTAAPECAAAIAEQCVVAGTSVTIASGTFAVTGARPLVVIAYDTLAVAGTLDAASHTGTPSKQGPGANAACAAFGANPTTHGGGAGGSFGSAGTAGAGNSDGETGGAPSGPAGPAFRAGCRGQDAGTVTESRFGLGGLGGGAVYLIAGGAIDVDGAINASGAAGNEGQCTPAVCSLNSGDNANGGGGGGSGGTIVLEAPAITVDGKVFADGAGGGEAASHSNNGRIGTEPDGLTAALGGAGGTSNGGNGGNGAHAATPASAATPGDPSTNGPGGGGGGGGGLGLIRVHGAASIGGNGASTMSPTPTFD